MLLTVSLCGHVSPRTAADERVKNFQEYGHDDEHRHENEQVAQTDHTIGRNRFAPKKPFRPPTVNIWPNIGGFV
jgi:hypothetical protein